MTTFRFNFCGSAAEDKEQNDGDTVEIKWLESKEVVPDKQIKSLDDNVIHAKMFTCGDVEIGHVLAKEAVLGMGDADFTNAVELAEKEHSDLVSGKYEGGLKIWECTTDLIEYLEKNEDQIHWKNAKVLDLGCGAGILGIYAFINGSLVTFQDYNKEVLECVTIPNVLLNMEEEDRQSEITKCKFYSGDWASFNKNLTDLEVYDIIMTSETIYNPHNYEKLIELFAKRLSKNGVAYVAAKTYYFGVGGGTRQFEERIEKNNLLSSKVCWKSAGGIQREIFKIARKL